MTWFSGKLIFGFMCQDFKTFFTKFRCRLGDTDPDVIDPISSYRFHVFTPGPLEAFLLISIEKSSVWISYETCDTNPNTRTTEGSASAMHFAWFALAFILFF